MRFDQEIRDICRRAGILTEGEVIPFRSKKQHLEALLRTAIAQHRANQLELQNELDKVDEWLEGPMPPNWVPTVSELNTVSGYAEGFYDGPPDEDFSWEYLVQQIDETETDSPLRYLNNKQLEILVAYGESRDWNNLSPSDFRKFISWGK